MGTKSIVETSLVAVRIIITMRVEMDKLIHKMVLHMVTTIKAQATMTILALKILLKEPVLQYIKHLLLRTVV